MPLASGTRLGPYEIISPLGAGGMGEVYRARDTRLDRIVAVKVSAEQFSERFAREARVVSSLNHPHICTIYDVGPDYLVMEMIEGATLAERIGQGPLPMTEALAIARQVAEALEAAHEKGVIHRDLKPANVKVTGEGTVKVLDFGLAKVTEGRTGSDPAASPTLTLGATQLGMILGTAAYMAPEQARGAVVDRRADIWAFGCLLYEMLTARQTFSGESVTDILAAVVRGEPDWKALPASTPAPILRLLRRSLEKDRKHRLPDIGVARLEIDDALAQSGAPAPVAAAPAVRRSALPWIVAALAVVATVLTSWAAWHAAADPIWMGAKLGGPTNAFMPRLSPDGQLLAFSAFIDGLPQVGVMKPDGGSWTMLTHDRENGYVTTVAWAADGSRIYFDRMWGMPRGVYSVLPLGGEPRLLLENAFGPTPLADGTMIVAKLTDRADDQLFHFWPESGRLEPLPAFTPGSDGASYVSAFPDGKEVAFWGADGESGRTRQPRLYVLNLASRQLRERAAGIALGTEGWGSGLATSPDGETVYVLAREGDNTVITAVPRQGDAKARPIFAFPNSARPLNFDVARDGSIYLDQMRAYLSSQRFTELEKTLEREMVLPDNSSDRTASGDGDVLLTVTAQGRSRLMLVRPDGESRFLVETSEPVSAPAVIFADSVAFVIGSGDDRKVGVASLRDGRVTQRFPAKIPDLTGALTAAPDGQTLYYAAGGSVWAQPVAGGDRREITAGTDVAIDPAGRQLYIRRSEKERIGLFRVPVGGGDPEPLPVPAAVHVSGVRFAPGAVDARGRLLLTVNLANIFYYRTALFDPASKSLTVIPVSFDGDQGGAGWAPGGKIDAWGQRYMTSLWRYRAR